MPDRTKNLIFTTSMGEVVRAWRKRRTWTLTELARRSHISKGYLSLLENGGIDRPDDSRLMQIANTLHMPVEYLINRRLYEDLSIDEQKKIEAQWHLLQADEFMFNSALEVPPQQANQEDKQVKELDNTGVSVKQADKDTQWHQIWEKFTELQEKFGELERLLKTFSAQEWREQ